MLNSVVIGNKIIKDKIKERLISSNNKKQQSQEISDIVMENYYKGKIDTYKEILELLEVVEDTVRGI
mgnify:CR=1 FL=1